MLHHTTSLQNERAKDRSMTEREWQLVRRWVIFMLPFAWATQAADFIALGDFWAFVWCLVIPWFAISLRRPSLPAPPTQD